ncbi:hypothetical protein P153DRAFT_386162 [Dothidotthia symphoricarpi CBS 119687]|uniref:SMP domain-containing protein n=1 Tax=Dothidotthia symphoricarpi CBS 119687 TaxID=1392245 RepID=A0A6A6AAL6_9PLEO|nr:uncharacterized protein P153DRAFT_386162 [Dothidotthia symphoricarpi CBS 119687]KAF2128962.1 hypothetical protein P153DRAFT_386162 [Dothidotthia symphoricarpi CBS 119687]
MSSNNQNQNQGGKHPMDKSDSSRIQSTQAQGGKDTGKDAFAARAQSAGDKNANSGAASKQGGDVEKK